MAEYRLLIKPSAVKEIEAAGAKCDRQRIISRIQALAANPRPVGCEKLAGVSTLIRFRKGAYRIICTVNDARRTVEVVKVGHRREVYRNAP